MYVPNNRTRRYPPLTNYRYCWYVSVGKSVEDDDLVVWALVLKTTSVAIEPNSRRIFDNVTDSMSRRTLDDEHIFKGI